MSAEELNEPNLNNTPNSEDTLFSDTKAVSGLYQDWFLDYASYVILERAVPALEDGLKPVQRRLLHALYQMDDGRFHKVANVIGQTMQYHPHGDASIEEALVNMGQKDLMIDTQGNWGDPRTGDGAAAARYIEAKLSKFALDVSFNADITEWQLSYDGRKREPIHLPVKFPLLLHQGVEGIAVGLATKVLPHNFCELIEGAIALLKGETVQIYPDFATGGSIDVSNYNDGLRGGKVKVRATIEELDKKTLVIRDLPYGITTGALVESILKANEKGKIKIKQVVDNTAKDVELQIKLAPNISPSVTIDALYAFTDCETSISPNACVISDDKPLFLGVSEMLRLSTEHTRELLRQELEIKLQDLREAWHFASLEKIFIEKRIYRQIEECETWESVLETIKKGLSKYVVPPSEKPRSNDSRLRLLRDITEEDLVRLTEIKIKRISKYDSFKADENMKALEAEMENIRHHLANLTAYTIAYFKNLLKKYGKGRERRTKIKGFDTIAVQQVAAINQKLYVDRKNGFIGYGLKKDEWVCDCSDIDDIIVFRKDCRFLVTRIAEKTYVGKDIVHVAVWKKNDERTVYNMMYAAPELGKNFAKRFAVTAITRNSEYDLAIGTTKPKLLYFTANPNGESEIVSVQLTPESPAKIKIFDFNFGEMAIKGRQSQGNLVSKYAIRKVVQKEVGKSTLGGRNIWVDEVSGKLNTEERGKFLGNFNTGDSVLLLYKDGSYELSDFDLNRRFPMENLLVIEKFNPDTVLSCIYWHGERKAYYVKRFKIETSTLGQRFVFISEEPKSALALVSTAAVPQVQYHYNRGAKNSPDESDTVRLDSFIEVKGWKSLGNKLSLYKVVKINELEPLEIPESEDIAAVDEMQQHETGEELLPHTEAADKDAAATPPPAADKKKAFKVGESVEWDIDSSEQGSLFV